MPSNVFPNDLGFSRCPCRCRDLSRRTVLHVTILVLGEVHGWLRNSHEQPKVHRLLSRVADVLSVDLPVLRKLKQLCRSTGEHGVHRRVGVLVLYTVNSQLCVQPRDMYLSRVLLW